MYVFLVCQVVSPWQSLLFPTGSCCVLLLLSLVHCCLGGRRTGGYGDRPSSYDSGMARSSYGSSRIEEAPRYGSYGSMFMFTYWLAL